MSRCASNRWRRLVLAPPSAKLWQHPKPPPFCAPADAARCSALPGRIEKALRRFRKQTNQVGHLRILRNRKTFESAHDKAIRKAKESAMRKARERRSMRARNN